MSVRDNILFGRPFDHERYKNACFAADLWSDFEQFPDGDATEIGELGINLSGGQKQRVSFARAVYSGADLLLLDDVLSAVDVHVGHTMMKKGILGALSGTTRILVTHAVHFMKHADYVVVVDSGKIKHFGTPAELRERGVNVKGYAKPSSQEKKDPQANTRNV